MDRIQDIIAQGTGTEAFLKLAEETQATISRLVEDNEFAIQQGSISTNTSIIAGMWSMLAGQIAAATAHAIIENNSDDIVAERLFKTTLFLAAQAALFNAASPAGLYYSVRDDDMNRIESAYQLAVATLRDWGGNLAAASTFPEGSEVILKPVAAAKYLTGLGISMLNLNCYAATFEDGIPLFE